MTPPKLPLTTQLAILDDWTSPTPAQPWSSDQVDAVFQAHGLSRAQLGSASADRKDTEATSLESRGADMATLLCIRVSFISTKILFNLYCFSMVGSYWLTQPSWGNALACVAFALMVTRLFRWMLGKPYTWAQNHLDPDGQATAFLDSLQNPRKSRKRSPSKAQ